MDHGYKIVVVQPIASRCLPADNGLDVRGSPIPDNR